MTASAAQQARWVGGFAGDAAALVRRPSVGQASEVVSNLAGGAVRLARENPRAALTVAAYVAAPALTTVAAVGAALGTGGLAVKNMVESGSVSEGLSKTGEQVSGAVGTVRDEASKSLDVVRGWMRSKRAGEE